MNITKDEFFKKLIKHRIMLIVISLIVIGAISFSVIEFKKVSIQNKRNKILSDYNEFNNNIEKYKEIKDSLNNGLYSASELDEINKYMAAVEGVMSSQYINDFNSKLNEFDVFINNIHKAKSIDERNKYKEVLEFDISWLNDSEREKYYSIANEAKTAFNSGDFDYDISALVELNSEFEDLIDRRKNNSRSLHVKEPSYINGILIVNKHFALPSSYNYGEDKEARKQLNNMISDAKKEGIYIREISGFRSYNTQKSIYSSNVRRKGEYLANMYSAKEGESEHQAGLAFDLGSTKNRNTDLSQSFENTVEGKWLKDNCYKYGFILRYLKGKESITGYAYEPWHFRYVGKDHAANIHEKGITLEEYLGLYSY